MILGHYRGSGCGSRKNQNAALIPLGFDDEGLDEEELQQGNHKTGGGTSQQPAGKQGFCHGIGSRLSVAGKAGGVARVMRGRMKGVRLRKACDEK
jgi:hypothetical protein